MRRRILLILFALLVPLAAAACDDEAGRVLDPEPSGDPVAPVAPAASPRADAGPDLKVVDLDEDGVERVVLDGCACKAGSSPISSYAWTEGPVALNGAVGDAGCSLAVDMETGRHVVRLTVVDEAGGSASDEVTVDVRSPYPVLTVLAPGAGAAFATGSEVRFQAAAVDWRGRAIEGDRLVWTSDLDGPLGSGAAITRSDLRKGDHAITLTATDSDGYTATVTSAVRIADGPTVTILAPVDGQTCAVLDEMHLEGFCVDGDGNRVTGESVYWAPDMWMGEWRRFEQSVDVVCTGPGPQTISLTCTDENGITARAEVTVEYVLSYRFNVQAVLADFGCTGCHGAGRQDGGVRLDTHLALTTGGTGSGPLIVPGDASAGILIPRLLAPHHDPDWQKLTTPFYWGWVDPATWGSIERWWVERFLAPWIANGAPDN
jgi:hypothetical protein